MLTYALQQHYEFLKIKGDYSTAFSFLLRNPEIMGVEIEAPNLKPVYEEFRTHLSDAEIEEGLTKILQDITGNPASKFSLAA